MNAPQKFSDLESHEALLKKFDTFFSLLPHIPEHCFMQISDVFLPVKLVG